MIMNMQLLVRDVRVRVRVDLLALSMTVLVHVRVRAGRVPPQLVGGVRVVVVHLVVLLLFGDDRCFFVVVLLVGVVRELAHGFAACVLPVVLYGFAAAALCTKLVATARSCCLASDAAV